MLVREIGQRPLLEKWKLAVFVTICIEISAINRKASNFKGVNEIVEKYERFMKKVEEYGLFDVYELKPLLNGKEIAALLGEQPGPKIGVFIEKMIQWQLENPSGDVGDAKEWIQKEKGGF